MGKYGDFKVVRTERRMCKRRTDPNADEDGMREYSFLKCPHCGVEEISILTDGMRNNKRTVVRDHITVCTEFEGERPVKRCVEVKERTSYPIVPLNTASSQQSMAIVPIHDKLVTTKSQVVDPQEFERLKAKVDQLTQQQAQHHVWWGEVAVHMGLPPPQDPPVLVDAVRMIKESSSSAALIMSEDAKKMCQQRADFSRMLTQKDETILQKDDLISGQKQLLEKQTEETLRLEAQHKEEAARLEAQHKEGIRLKEAEIRDAKERLEAQQNEAERQRVEAEKQQAEAERQRVEAEKQQAEAEAQRVTVKRLQDERDAMESKFRAQLKRQRCGTSKSLLSQAEQGHKTRVTGKKP